jgi:hypothetical protein
MADRNELFMKGRSSVGREHKDAIGVAPVQKGEQLQQVYSPLKNPATERLFRRINTFLLERKAQDQKRAKYFREPRKCKPESSVPYNSTKNGARKGWDAEIFPARELFQVDIDQ